MNLYQNSIAPTHECSEGWKGLTSEERLDQVSAVLNGDETIAQFVAITEAKDDGQVIVSFLEPVGADRRGTILLDLEERLKREAELGITLWLEPQGDKSALRKLRGIEVK
jgi:hypothetical protein